VSADGEFRRAYDAYFDSAMHQIDSARREPVKVVLDEPVSEAGRKAIQEVIAFIRSRLPRVVVTVGRADPSRQPVP